MKTWSNTYKRMMNVLSIHFDKDICTVVDEQETVYEQRNPMARGLICRATEELDIKNEEIYENDFLLGWWNPDWDDDSENVCPMEMRTKEPIDLRKTFTTIVRYENGGFFVDAPTGNYDKTLIGWAKKEGFWFKILGNSFEIHHIKGYGRDDRDLIDMVDELVENYYQSTGRMKTKLYIDDADGSYEKFIEKSGFERDEVISIQTKYGRLKVLNTEQPKFTNK